MFCFSTWSRRSRQVWPYFFFADVNSLLLKVFFCKDFSQVCWCMNERLTIIQKQNSMLKENSPVALCNGGMALCFNAWWESPESELSRWFSLTSILIRTIVLDPIQLWPSVLLCHLSISFSANKIKMRPDGSNVYKLKLIAKNSSQLLIWISNPWRTLPHRTIVLDTIQ